MSRNMITGEQRLLMDQIDRIYHAIYGVFQKVLSRLFIFDINHNYFFIHESYFYRNVFPFQNAVGIDINITIKTRNIIIFISKQNLRFSLLLLSEWLS